MRWVVAGAGVLLAAATWVSVIRTLVVPRGLSSMMATAAERVTRSLFLFTADRFESYRAKDRILALLGPMLLGVQLFVWIVAFLIAFALILWPLEPGGLGTAMRQSGSAMFTLGFAAAETAAGTVVHFIAAATGLVVVALQIAYLPTIYASFNRRETLVTTLQTRAGAPAWGPEVLARHHLVEMLDELPGFYTEWERWAADVAETHANYPVLVYFRSPHPLRSWLLALLAVMDSAALYLSLCPSLTQSAARLTIRMGFTALRDIAAGLGIAFDPDPLPSDPIELTEDEFRTGVARLVEAGFPMERTPEEAWQHFKGWRVNYESVAYAIADRIVAVPGPWSGARARVPGTTIDPVRPIDRRAGQETERLPKLRSEWRP